jgi:uncharacterized protein DUF4430
VRKLFLVLVVAALAGCGGEDGGKATIWITRDKGAHVLLQQRVPSGLTAMQALDRVADIDTRYAGRYVQAINGLEGSLTSRRDWFYFINGYEGDRSAAEYRLRAGDVEWWDFRSWENRMREPVAVGAFPEPFLHGYDGKTRPARIVYSSAVPRELAEKIAKLLHGRATRAISLTRDAGANVLVLSQPRAAPSLRATLGRSPGPGAAVVFVFHGNPELLLKNPPFGRLRYEVRG